MDETQAKVAPPNQVNSISFAWGENSVELSLYTEPLKKPHIRTTRRQFYRATVHTADGKKQELQEEAAPVSPLARNGCTDDSLWKYNPFLPLQVPLLAIRNKNAGNAGSVSDLLMPKYPLADKKSGSPVLLVFVTLVTKG